MKVKNRALNILLDGVALMIALAIDLVLNIISMLIIAPGPLEAIGFVGMAIIIVLFAVRAWLKGGWNGKALWAIFAIIALFFDTSFVLETTKMQTQTSAIIVTVETDTELPRLSLDIETANNEYNELVAQQRMSVNKTKIENLKDQITRADEKLLDAKNKYSERVALIESGKVTKQLRQNKTTLQADNIFYAIPNAVSDKRLIPLFVFLIMFIGLQLTIITAASNTTEKPLLKKQKETHTYVIQGKNWSKLVDIWMDVVWKNDPPALRTEIDFFEILRLEKKVLDKTDYNRIMRAANVQKVIVDGKIAITEKNEAKRRIMLDKLLS